MRGSHGVGELGTHYALEKTLDEANQGGMEKPIANCKQNKSPRVVGLSGASSPL